MALNLTGSYTTSVAFVALAVLLSAFGYDVKRGKRYAHVVVIIIGLGPLISAGIRLMTTDTDTWGHIEAILWAAAVLGGVTVSGLVLQNVLASWRDAPRRSASNR